MEIESKLIFKPEIARKLLKQGHTIIDIKANRNNSDMSIFVFKIDNTLLRDLELLIQ